MKPIDVLFLHSNFPAQFRNLATHLGANPRFRVKAIGSASAVALSNVELRKYAYAPGSSAEIHSFARRFDQECRRAEQVMYTANGLKADGFDPVLIYVHPGWGESLPLRSLFPRARIVVYAEFFYTRRGADVGFDPEFDRLGVDGQTRVALRNATTLLALADADAAIAPTQWQRSLFPQEFRSKIRVIHDGIDTSALHRGSEEDAKNSEIVTYVARNLEPYRGFHVFMRSLPQLLRARPKAQVHIVGGDGVSYGNGPLMHDNWRKFMLAELGGALDLSRIHFRGKIPHDAYVALLKQSSVHVYLTYPFVLSWSVLEAMSLGCHVVGSDTEPVREVIEDGVNGMLVPFDNPVAIADSVSRALQRRHHWRGQRDRARQRIVERFDLKTVVLPAHTALISELVPELPATIFSKKPSDAARRSATALQPA